MPSSQHHRRLGFTMIELLVVMIIIILLAALLFGVFHLARERARDQQCLANQRQIAVQVQTMVDDNNGRYPTAGAVWMALSRSGRRLTCPKQPEVDNGYGYNAWLQLAPAGNLDHPDQVIVCADSIAACDNLLREEGDLHPRHRGGKLYYGFADGHAARGVPQPLQW